LPSLEEIRDLYEWLKRKIKVSRKALRLSSSFGYRSYMIARYREMLGTWDEVTDLLQAFEKDLNPVVRCNKLKVGDCNKLFARLQELGYGLSRIPWCSECVELNSGGGIATLGSLHEFLLGLYYLYRGKASLIPPLLLNPGCKDRVLDMAAAPGGKTTHMAQIMMNRGVVVATDVSRRRMRALRSNVERMGIHNAVLVRTDARNLPSIYPAYFTKVLLDAPCSGEGLIMVDPSRKTKTSLKELLRLHNLQVELLNSALDAVMPGHRVLYTTCSIAPEENELVIAKVISSREDINIEPANPPIPHVNGMREYFNIEIPEEVGRCVRLYPHLSGTEGFFLCLLRRL
jgi:NOL1/NOP2/sun family putative RNA methylase